MAPAASGTMTPTAAPAGGPWPMPLTERSDHGVKQKRPDHVSTTGPESRAPILARGSLRRYMEVVDMWMTRSLGVLMAVGLIGAGMLAGCEKGPAQKAGEKIDKAVDKLTGKGPAEKAGERIDEAVDAIKKK